MATINATNVTANLTANGNSQGNGTISWTRPNIPTNAVISSIVVNGEWDWGGKGNINKVTINGTQVLVSTQFSIELGANATSPISITCTGNKNATGDNFTWTGLQVVYTYDIYYNVSIQTTINGTINLSNSGQVKEGTTITVTSIPDKGYKLEAIYVNSFVITGNTFTVDSDCIVNATFIEDTSHLCIKENGQWVTMVKCFKKINGSWIEQEITENLLNTSAKYIYLGFQQ